MSAKAVTTEVTSADSDSSGTCFTYSLCDFVHELRADAEPTPFDRRLDDAWWTAMERGLFRFQWSPHVATVCLSGQYGFYVQANSNRHKTRRHPPHFTSTRQAFSADCFHFGRVPSGELLFRVTSSDDRPCDWPNGQPISADADADWLMINVSPIAASHVLLVPARGRLRPQRLTCSALIRLIDLLLLSNCRWLRGIYNSLGALASVNHCHLHLYRFCHQLYLETVPTVCLCDDLMCVVEYPAPAILFTVDRHNRASVARRVCWFTELILDLGLAFNMFITRGTDPRAASTAATATTTTFTATTISSNNVTATTTTTTATTSSTSCSSNTLNTSNFHTEQQDHQQPEAASVAGSGGGPSGGGVGASSGGGEFGGGSGGDRGGPSGSGSASGGCSSSTTPAAPADLCRSVLRVYVWPRLPVWNQSYVTIASCELAGHFTLHDDSSIHDQSEKDLSEQLSQMTSSAFEMVRNCLLNTQAQQ